MTTFAFSPVLTLLLCNQSFISHISEGGRESGGLVKSAVAIKRSEQRIYITRRRDSNIPSSYTNLTHRTSPYLLCRQLYRRTGRAVYCRQSGERLGESNFCKTMAGAVPSISLIYILWFKFKILKLYFMYLDPFHHWNPCFEQHLG